VIEHRDEREETATANAWPTAETLNAFFSGSVRRHRSYVVTQDFIGSGCLSCAERTSQRKIPPLADFGSLKIIRFERCAMEGTRLSRSQSTITHGAREDRARLGGTERSMLPGSQVPEIYDRRDALGGDRPLAQGCNSQSRWISNGSEGIFFAPFRDFLKNDAEIPNWPGGFHRGAFLPLDRSVRPDGASAEVEGSLAHGQSYPDVE